MKDEDPHSMTSADVQPVLNSRTKPSTHRTLLAVFSIATVSWTGTLVAQSPVRLVPSTDTIEVVECSRNVPQPPEDLIPKGLTAPEAYQLLQQICSRAGQRPAAIVKSLKENGKSSLCTALALRERLNSYVLSREQQPMWEGMAVCTGDTLITWQGVELVYQTFKPDGKGWAEPGILEPLSRLQLADGRTTLVEGRLSYFADPDYPEKRVELGRARRAAGFWGTFVQLEVLDTCTSEGTVTVPIQDVAATGETHQVSVCRLNDADTLECTPKDKVQEGQVRSIMNPDKLPRESSQSQAELLAKAAQDYQRQKTALVSESVVLPKKDKDFIPEPPKVTITVGVTPATANVWLDGVPLKVPKGIVTIDVSPGPHVLLGRGEGFEDQTIPVIASEDKPRSVVLNLAPVGSGIEWITIPGGTFTMGSNDYDDEKPPHTVTVSAFEMSKSEVTVAQYRACHKANPKGCTKPDTGTSCNWDQKGRDNHPINCVDWKQAKAFAAWMGGRLPNEAEWEYAAKGEKGRMYPWGDTPEPNCDVAVMSSCPGETQPTCLNTSGNTSAGLCDMAGNVWEWVEDCYENTYTGAPDTGISRTKCSGTYRVIRGGGADSLGDRLRTADRGRMDAGDRRFNLGFRVVRMSPSK